MKKAINIQDNFGDFALSCPYCKKPLIFPLNYSLKNKTYKCLNCDKKIKLF